MLQIDGCYNFSVDTKVWTDAFFPCKGFTQAYVTEDETGVTVYQNYTGPKEVRDRRKCRFDAYTNRYFKPGLPYYGKVIVTKPDGSPASGEAVEVIADSRQQSLRFKRTFTTDKSGKAKFALCRSFTAATKGLKISAGILNTDFCNRPVSTNTKISNFMESPSFFWEDTVGENSRSSAL
ncbi:alpha-2-macroglobulin-like protein [Plakobranchus ocellatus]|uniref:Alpha-2-macroglobulin-like protein n=1 Tax=Plakobranchus ocellatus TaxID=259542 RepID=A0AAV4CIZ4_9GAST|nr:alpha-2-macroglobulin-like protein [Plakobranchus ocellatus]